MGKFGSKKIEIVPFAWKWYLGRADSESGVRFWKFRPKNSFLGKFRLKKSKLSVEDTDLYSGIIFFEFRNLVLFLGKFGPKKTKLPFCLIFIPTLVFWSSKPKSIFWANLSQKSRIVYYLPGSWHAEYLEDMIARIPRKVWEQR